MSVNSLQIDIDHLPNTVGELKALVIFLLQHIAKQDAIIESQAKHIAKQDAIIESQQAQIHQLQRIVFGRRPEKSKNKQERASYENKTLGELLGILIGPKGLRRISNRI